MAVYTHARPRPLEPLSTGPMVVYWYIVASAASCSTAEAHGLEPGSTTKSAPLHEKSGVPTS